MAIADKLIDNSAYTVTFWHRPSLRTSGNANDEPLAKIVL